MKKRNSYFLIALTALSGFFFTMCDKVEQPYQNITPGGGGSSGNEIVDSMTGTILRKIFIEDYTGHQCGNCPKAVDTINSIMAAYPDRVVAVGVHSGYYSITTPAPYIYNFVVEDPTTPGYNELDNFFQISANGNPNGMVNRRNYNVSTQTHVQGIDLWKGEASQIVLDTSKVQISITTATDSVTNHSINATFKVKFLKSLTGNYKLATMIIEDSIVKPQKDYRFSPDDITNYVHRHVLRGYLYGAFGEQIGTQDPIMNSTDTKTYNVSIPSKVMHVRHCAVVAYVYDETTYEVLQAEELELIP